MSWRSRFLSEDQSRDVDFVLRVPCLGQEDNLQSSCRVTEFLCFQSNVLFASSVLSVPYCLRFRSLLKFVAFSKAFLDS